MLRTSALSLALLLGALHAPSADASADLATSPCDSRKARRDTTSLPPLKPYVRWQADGQPVSVVWNDVRLVAESLPDGPGKTAIEDSLVTVLTYAIAQDNHFIVHMDASTWSRFQRGRAQLDALYGDRMQAEPNIALGEPAAPDLVLEPLLDVRRREVHIPGSGYSSVYYEANLRVLITRMEGDRREVLDSLEVSTSILEVNNGKSKVVNVKQPYKRAAMGAAERFAAALQASMPLVGTVMVADGDQLISNLGSELGVDEESCFAVVRTTQVTGADGAPRSLRSVLGYARPVAVAPGESQLQVLWLADRMQAPQAADQVVTVAPR